jgi:hypothetical protein
MSWSLLLALLIQIESGGNHASIGDRHLANKAYGILQIRQPYLDDVNRIYKKQILAFYGRPLVMEDIRRSPRLSRWVTVSYLKHYGKRYERLTGQAPTYEVYVRIHAGGPNGWKKDSTDLHWNRFDERLQQYQERKYKAMIASKKKKAKRVKDRV